MAETDTIVAEVVEHSIITDPAFSKLNNLLHAESCEKPFCRIPNCAETKFLLKHVGRCTKDRCKYKDCPLSKTLLAHNDSFSHDSPDCPLCKKREVIKRLHPGKGPRAELDDDDDETIDDNDQENEDGKRMDSEPPPKRLNLTVDEEPAHIVSYAEFLEVLGVTPEVPKDAATDAAAFEVQKARMQQMMHSQQCRWEYCCKPCYWMKKLLAHIKECFDWNCPRAGCQPTKELLYHQRNCRMVDNMCALCLNTPEPEVYHGKDYFEEMPPQILRHISLLLDNQSLERLSQVNKRVAGFFALPGEIKGLFQKPKYPILSLEQLKDGSFLFHFENDVFTDECHENTEFVHVFAKTGEQERIRYAPAKGEAMTSHIDNKYGWIDHDTTKLFPAPLPPAFYEGLTLALQKYDFENLHLGSILMDNSFTNFFLKGRNKIEFHLHDREMALLNSRID